jgi:hypothetical protein
MPAEQLIYPTTNMRWRSTAKVVEGQDVPLAVQVKPSGMPPWFALVRAVTDSLDPCTAIVKAGAVPSAHASGA